MGVKGRTGTAGRRREETSWGNHRAAANPLHHTHLNRKGRIRAAAGL